MKLILPTRRKFLLAAPAVLLSLKDAAAQISMPFPGPGRAGGGGSSFTAIINFRATSNFVTDGANSTYCLGEGYPVSRNGWTFGWNTSVGNNDRSNSVGPQFAGNNTASPSAVFTFRYDLPNGPGVYHVNYSIGDAGGFAQSTQITIKDDTTTLNTGGVIATTGTQYADISGTTFSSPANWLAGNTPAVLTFASSILNLQLTGQSSNNAVVTTLTVTQ